MTLSSATIPGQSKPGSDGDERVLCISQCSSITESQHQMVLFHIEDTRWGLDISPPSAEM